MMWAFPLAYGATQPANDKISKHFSQVSSYRYSLAFEEFRTWIGKSHERLGWILWDFELY